MPLRGYLLSVYTLLMVLGKGNYFTCQKGVYTPYKLFFGVILNSLAFLDDKYGGKSHSRHNKNTD